MLNILLFYYKYQKRFQFDIKTISTSREKVQNLLDTIKYTHKKVIIGNIYNINSFLNLKKPKMLIIFSPTDCSFCLHEIELWKFITKDSLIHVLGILAHDRFHEAKIFAKNENINFPLLYIDKHLMEKYIDFSETPIKIILDDRNNILSIVKTLYDPDRKKKFMKYIQSL
jgi:glutaredoxin